MITSRYASEGKSYVSMNLMRTLSQLGRTVVLVDADLRASGIQNEYRLRYSNQEHHGLSEYLSGHCTLDEVLYQTDIPGAAMIPAGHEAPNPLQLLDTKMMSDLIDMLSKQYDVVLVDTPPVGVLIDAVALAKFCDGTLLVVGYQKGRRQEIGDAVANIKQTGCKMLGAVLNGVKFNSMSNKHYYYSSERYSAHYSKRYNGRKK
jgi:capsular exopolysaccharide synthesis family protein